MEVFGKSRAAQWFFVLKRAVARDTRMSTVACPFRASSGAPAKGTGLRCGLARQRFPAEEPRQFQPLRLDTLAFACQSYESGQASFVSSASVRTCSTGMIGPTPIPGQKRLRFFHERLFATYSGQ